MNDVNALFSILFAFIFFLIGFIYVLVSIFRRIMGFDKKVGRSAPPTVVRSNAIPQNPVSHAPRVESKSAVDEQLRMAIAVGAKQAEDDVEVALRGLKEHRYFVFRDLIIPSSSAKLSFTEIDHVVISHFGIFCIETKSHKGNIYGFSRNEKWKQYLNGNKIHELNSPFRQNYHHVRSLEALLAGGLNAPIHSYVAFPYARKVVVDSQVEDMTPRGVIQKINKHTRIMYDDADVERIAKTLAHAATFRESLKGQHIDEVRAYVHAKVADSVMAAR